MLDLLMKVMNLFIQLFVVYLIKSRNSVVGIATGYELDDRGVRVRVPVRSRIFSSPRRPVGAHPPCYPMGTGGFFPGVKRQGCEANHSPPASAVKKKVKLSLYRPWRPIGL
jgi:hypothetical protein